MRRGLLLSIWLVGLVLYGQATWSINQVVSFVKSSVQLHQPDKQVAGVLRKAKLSQRLEERVIVELEAQGAGPQTVAALRELAAASKDLPAPPLPASKTAAPVGPPPPSTEQQQDLLDRVRQYALNYVRSLPDFICTQVTRRYVDPTGMEFWQSQDVLTAKLTYFEQKEDYKLMLVNGVMTDKPYLDVGGATSTGEFGSMMREIFEKQTEATFRWARWATLRGKLTHVFNYNVDQAHSQWRIEYEKTERVIPAYHGLIYVDASNAQIVRITLTAENIPPTFPVQEASTILDFDYVKIADRVYLLPLKAVVRMRHGKFLVKNEVEFRMYRKYSAEATITFDTPAPLPEDKTTEQPPTPNLK